MKRIAENRVKAGAAGGIEAVVKVINTHINNANVCVNGCGVLWSITVNGKRLIKQRINTTNETNR